jgi:hypothetical protein
MDMLLLRSGVYVMEGIRGYFQTGLLPSGGIVCKPNQGLFGEPVEGGGVVAGGDGVVGGGKKIGRFGGEEELSAGGYLILREIYDE